MPWTFDPVLDQLLVPNGIGIIPEYTSDPINPSPNSAWILYSPGAIETSLFPLGLLLESSATPEYQFSYRTSENTTIRVTMS